MHNYLFLESLKVFKMKISFPRNNLKEMIIYIWKIIEYSQISKKELLYRLSFNLSLFSPEEAQIFIEKSIENNYLLEKGKDLIELSPELEKKLKNWQNERKDAILKKIKENKEAVQIKENFRKNKKSTFNILLKAFLDKGTLNRAVTISDDSIRISIFDVSKGILKAQISGSKEKPYIVNINTEKKSLKHDCQDFQTKRLANKKFCKHLVKLFLFLKENDEDSAKELLEAITDNIEDWGFYT
jgi:hypothetical protein